MNSFEQNHKINIRAKPKKRIKEAVEGGKEIRLPTWNYIFRIPFLFTFPEKYEHGRARARTRTGNHHPNWKIYTYSYYRDLKLNIRRPEIYSCRIGYQLTNECDSRLLTYISMVSVI